ncbi:ABC transporter permease [Paenibacillus tepidiphilus]|uniref:ABC transporter permease n=1 Tax=Paenibacillus tepidiphilus TaxID=2608683 RepID=UPI0012396A50|nr:ABC transporter permease [Paenibacillus tepidiphilus]
MKLIIGQCKAELLRIFRNPYFIFWSLAMPILFYFLFTRVINTGAEDAGEWRAHYLMSMAAFSVMGSSIMTLGIRLVQERNQGWNTYIRITPLPAYAFFLGKMVGQTAVHVFSVICIFAAGYVNGVELSSGQWIFSGLWIVAGSLPFLALGTLIGMMKRVDTASGVSNVLYMGLAIAGGMWMPLEILPKTVQEIGHWLPSYNYGSGAWAIVRGDHPQGAVILILGGYLALFMILSVYLRHKQRAV